MRSGTRAFIAIIMLGCAAAGASARPAPATGAPPDGQPVIGEPYMIDGTLHTPAAVLALDETGYAALLWETADGRRTASGEPYVPDAVTAAHRTLPLPSYVEVTALESGRTILVRVNDRGPLLNDRIIALSPGAARQLGLTAIDGTAPVRVRKVNPTEQERAALRTGQPVGERMEAPPGLRAALMKRLPPAPLPLDVPVRTLSMGNSPEPSAPAPAPAAVDLPAPAAHVEAAPETTLAAPQTILPPASPGTPLPEGPSGPAPVSSQPVHRPAATSAASPPASAPAAVSRRGGYVVQLAALSSRAKADALAKAVDGYVMPVGALFRVRTGPFQTQAAARTALRGIHAKGYAEARVMANDAR